MALKGTLKDFGLADIFQLISLQQKSGILKVKKGNEEVIISFLKGSVVWADTSKRELEEKLGQLLIKKGIITPHQLGKALAIQKKTLMRLGHILINEKFINREQLQTALSLQVKFIAYRIFRWKEGNYFFSQDSELDYDKANFMPISAESIFLECARMSDEWPIIESKIRSQDLIFEKVDKGDSEKLKIESIVDADIDFGFGEEGKEQRSDKIILSTAAASVYLLVNGKSPVREIIEKTDLGDFETSRILFELLNRNLIREVKTEKEIETEKEEQKRFISKKTIAQFKVWLAAALLLFLASLTILFWPSNIVNKMIQGQFAQYRDELSLAVSKSKIDKISKALEIYYLNSGTFPAKLNELVLSGYLDKSDIIDPWGQPYIYLLFDDAYRIGGLNSSHVLDENLLKVNQFSRTQKVILQTSSMSSGEKSNL